MYFCHYYVSFLSFEVTNVFALYVRNLVDVYSFEHDVIMDASIIQSINNTIIIYFLISSLVVPLLLPGRHRSSADPQDRSAVVCLFWNFPLFLWKSEMAATFEQAHFSFSLQQRSLGLSSFSLVWLLWSQQTMFVITWWMLLYTLLWSTCF